MTLPRHRQKRHIRLRPATDADMPRIRAIRTGVSENRLTDPERAANDAVAWYMKDAIFLVSEDEEGVQGFVCANHLTGCVWALFVSGDAQGRGHGTALLATAVDQLARAGHRQAFCATGVGTRAARFYAARGWRFMGENEEEEAIFVLTL
ncbi:MAG: GNAT family N-acetyltransferase [Hasllibacter sp.]